MRLFEVANKGIPRSQMPQIHVEDIKDDYNYRQGKLSLKKMKPVQTERVESEYKKAVQKIKSKQAKPILLDKNLRIVNGHHRYDAYRHLGFDSVPAVIVDATLEDLMSKYQHTSEEAGAGGGAAGGTGGATGSTGGATSSSGDSGSADSGDAGDSGSDSAEATPSPQPSRIGFFIGGWAAPSKKKKKKKKKNTVDFGKSIYEGYVKPQFDVEWDEAQRYPEFEKLGKEEWIKLAKTGKPVTIKTAKDINNTDAASPESFYDLDKSKQKRALQQVARGEVEMPLVARYSDGYKELLGGNTRLTAMMLRKGSATVWQFDVPDEVATLAEGPKDFDNMNLDQKGKQDSIDYFYHTHAPTFGKPTKAGSFKGHNIVTFKTPDGTLMFLVNRNDQAVFYVGLNKMPDGVAVGNVRSNGTIKATEVYRYLVSKYGKLYSDKHQTPDGRKIWANLAKYNPELKISDTGDRLMATENFADGKVKGKSRPGRVKKAGASCKGSVSSLRAKAKKYSGERGKMYHWCANMKSGKKK